LQAGGAKVEIGTPTLKTKVTAKVLKQGRAEKIRVVKYKPKVRYHKVYGHRQPFTEVQIEKIG
jgi:large subunit ribosomal protein L21